MDFSKIKDLLKGLINDKTSTEEAEKIGKISGEIDTLENEQKDFVAKHEELRNKYIEAVKNSSFKGNPTDEKEEETKPKSFEDCVNDVIKNRKEK